jgi:large subunit ribosomal protein L25
MSEVTLIAQTGRTIGTSSSKRLRAEGQIPAVLYGHGMASLSIHVDRRELRHALTGPAGANALVNLQVDGTTHPTIVKALQRDPIKRSVSHVDFLVVSLDEIIEVSVPFHLEGEAKAVIAEGGLVDAAVDTITVRTTPRNVPGAFSWDISEMQIGDVVRVSELTMPEGVELVDDPEAAIVTALAAQVEKVEEVEEVEGEEVAEGEAAAATSAEGGAAPGEGTAAPAAGDAAAE